MQVLPKSKANNTDLVPPKRQCQKLWVSRIKG